MGPVIPQPYRGVPGTGDLILTFLGDAGVVGRPDMMKVWPRFAG